MAPLPSTRPQIGVMAMTLRVRGRGVQPSLQTRSSVVLRREPPYEPKTLGDGIQHGGSVGGPVQPSWQTRASVVLRREPPYEPKTLGDAIHDSRSMRGSATER